MSTRSCIGIEGPGGRIRSVYCHYDGNPSSNGRVLVKFWNDREKIKSLLLEGDMSSLGHKVGKQHGMYGQNELAKKMGVRTYEQAQRYNWCTFYKRDDLTDLRSSGCRAVSHRDLASHCEDILDSDKEYCYIYGLDSLWHIWVIDSKNKIPVSVSKMMVMGVEAELLEVENYIATYQEEKYRDIEKYYGIKINQSYYDALPQKIKKYETEEAARKTTIVRHFPKANVPVHS